MAHTNQADLGHFIELICKAHASPHISHHLDQLLTYLDTHYEYVNAHPSCIRPLFNMTIGLSASERLNSLPETSALEKLNTLPPETHTQFWHFLSQRAPINKEDCERFIDMLAQANTNRGFHAALLALPPYLPLNYIMASLKFHPGKHYSSDAQARCADLTEAALALNECMLQRHIIRSTEECQSPIRTDDYSKIMDLFQRMSPSENRSFFTIANQYANLPLATIEKIATLYKEKQLNQLNLDAIFKIMNTVTLLPIAVQETVFTQCEASLQSEAPIVKTIEDMNRTLDAIKTECDTVQQAALALRTTQNYADYFSTVVSKNREKRQQIMQQLHHGLLDLGAPFGARCWTEYSNLVQRTVIVPETIGRSKEKQQQLRQSFQHLVTLTAEMATIARSPFGSLRLTTPSTTPWENPYDDYVQKQKTRYQTFFWTNKQRKAQARTLFESLSIPAEQDKNAYYTQALNAIWTSQQTILDSDKKTLRNIRGQSRLYDISTQLFLTVARGCLADKDVSDTTKQRLHTILEEQLVYHIQLLHERLAPSNALKKAMSLEMEHMDTNWNFNSTGLANLIDLIHKHKNRVPFYLTYIVREIEGYDHLASHDRSAGRQGPSVHN